MPAPTPIQIRYGPAGLLAQAASLVGQGEGWQNQHAQDMQFINGRLNNADRIQQEVVAGQQQNANRLQQAYAQVQPQQSAQAPALDNDVLLKQTYLQSAAADIPDAEKASLQALAGSRMVKPDQFRLAVADAAKRGAQTTNDAAEEASKADYANQVAGNLPPDAKAGFLALAKDKKTTAAQLRTAGDAILQRAAVTKRVQVSQQVQSIDNQARTVKAHMDALAREMAKAGVDVHSVTPDQLNPTLAQRPHNSSDFIPDAMTAGLAGLGLNPAVPGIVTGQGNVDQRPAYIAYQKMKAQLDALTAQRSQLSGGAGGGAGSPSDPTAVHVDNGGQIVTVNSPEEAAALPVGQAFQTPDGEVRVRH